MDSVKTNRTRRQRGYTFEYELVRRINSCYGWKAIRLGSPSVALPDVIAVNNAQGILLAIEAKSTSTDTIKVPMEQVARCINWLNLFTRYRHRYAILALKFMSKKWKKAYTYEHRALQEYYWLWDDAIPLNKNMMMNRQEGCNKGGGKDNSSSAANIKKVYITCRYDGSLYVYLNDDAGTTTTASPTSTITNHGEEGRMRLNLNPFTMPWQNK